MNLKNIVWIISLGSCLQLYAHKTVYETKVVLDEHHNHDHHHEGWHHHDWHEQERIYVSDPWYHRDHVYISNNNAYPVHYEGHPYYYYDPSYYYYTTPIGLSAPGINVNLNVGN